MIEFKYSYLYIAITILLLIIYYYSYTLINKLNTECNDCVINNYICNNLLINTPIILILIIIIKTLIFIPVFKNNINKLLLLEVVIYIVFLVCLYKSMSNLLNNKCKCVDNHKIAITYLFYFSKITAITLFIIIILLNLNILNKKNKYKYL